MYKSIKVNFNELLLDEENPRFVTSENGKLLKNEIMEYLINYENVIELADSICNFGGLVPGERLLVLKEDDNYVVLEGNRRTAAINILMHPEKSSKELNLSAHDREKINKLSQRVTDELKEQLSSFQVDIVSSRDEAIYSLTERHIDGIKRWSQISKMYFYQQHFDLGKTLADLEKYTGENPRSISDTLRKYSYLRFVLSAYRNKYPTGKYFNSDIETQIPTELIIQRVFNSLDCKIKRDTKKTCHDILNL